MLTKRYGKVVLALVVPGAIAGAALFAAQGVASLVDATLAEGSLSVTGSIVQGATPTFTTPRPTANAVLDRNPFDHTTSLRPNPATQLSTFRDLLAEIPTCEGLRPLVIVATDEPDVSFAAFEVEGKRVLRKRNGEIAGMRIAYIGRDRVLFEKNASGYCQAQLFAPHAKPNNDVHEREGSRVIQQPGTPSPFEKEIAGKIVKRSETEYEIDRATVDRILEAQAELMKARVLPEKEGDKVIGVRILSVKPGSVLSLIGIQSNDRLETINGFSIGTPEEALQAYARLRSGADQLTVHLTRNGKPMNIDYSIR